MSRWRALPVALLATLTVAAVAVRVTHRPAPRPSSSLHDVPLAGDAARSAERLAAARPLPDDAGARFAPTTLHGDTRRTHRARGHGPRTPAVAWRADVGAAIEAQVTTSPDEQTLYVATLGGTLTALARDGTTRWTVSLGGARAYATPCVAPSGVVYAGSDAKKLYAVSPAGAVVWQLELGDEVDTAPALLADGRIVVAAGKTLYAVRPGGDVAWRFVAKGKIFTAPAVALDGSIVFGAQDHRAYRVSDKGALLFATDLGADVDGAPAVADDGAFLFGTDGDEVVRLSLSGEVLWRANVGGFVRGPLSLARDGDVLAGVYGPTPREVRLAPDGGPVGALAVQGTGAREFGVHGGALEDDDGAVYFGAQDDAVYAIERTGELRWRFVAGDDVDAPLTLLQDGSLVVPSDDGKVVLLSAGR